MIPMRNRKKTLEVKMEEMRNFSFAYIEKYAPSKQQLRIILIIIVSVSIFGLLVFVFVKNHIRNVVNQLEKEEEKKSK